ncbi:MAG: hypothetical protein MUC38_11215 [Cyclobacteriaceae bacterium]|nr:hypothetical protein [Cyclobacteriaceae bacterium]
MKRFLFLGLILILVIATPTFSQLHPEPWRQIQLSSDPADVRGLVPVDVVSVKATGTTVLSSVTRVTYRVFAKAKMAASLLGGQVALLQHQSVEGNLIPIRTARASSKIKYSYAKPWEISMDQNYLIHRGIPYIRIRFAGAQGYYRIVYVDDRQIVCYQIKRTAIQQLVLLKK